MSRETVIPKGMEAYYERLHFAPAVRDGEFVLCSGQIGVEPDGQVSSDPEKQFTSAFEGVKTVLEAAGASLDDVVEMTTYHVGLQQHIRTFGAVKDRFIQEPYPAWTAIGITELALPGALVEIRVVARVFSSS